MIVYLLNSLGWSGFGFAAGYLIADLLHTSGGDHDHA